MKDVAGSEAKFALETDALALKLLHRSLQWPGFVNLARLHTNFFGFVYFGYGLENRDLAFTQC